MEAHYPFALPPLPYGYDALLPEIGERTLHFHHDKHFQTYIDNLNKLLEKHPEVQDWPLERLVQEWPRLPEEIRQGGFLGPLRTCAHEEEVRPGEIRFPPGGNGLHLDGIPQPLQIPL